MWEIVVVVVVHPRRKVQILKNIEILATYNID